MKLRDLLEGASYLPVDVRTKHDVQTEAKSFDTKAFVKAVKDEYDVETLGLMQGVIQKQLDLLNKMRNIVDPRKVVKGCRR